MRITGNTKLLGLFGWPVSHSFSPTMHNAAIAALGIDYAYLPLAVEPKRLRAAVAGLTALGFRGVNVTIPHKQAIMGYLSGISKAADIIGAVNTLVADGHAGFTGDNTDWSGFLADLQARHVSIRGRDCIVLGAGGSARAIVYALLKNYARVHLLARRQEAADQLVQSMELWFGSADISTAPLTSLPNLSTVNPLIINTTPLGMTPKTKSSIWPDDLPIPRGAFVYDLVYNPRTTKLMRQAQQAGCQTCNGLGMLLHQGAQSFKLWTGEEPDLAVMAAAIEG